MPSKRDRIRAAIESIARALHDASIGATTHTNSADQPWHWHVRVLPDEAGITLQAEVEDNQAVYEFEVSGVTIARIYELIDVVQIVQMYLQRHAEREAANQPGQDPFGITPADELRTERDIKTWFKDPHELPSLRPRDGLVPILVLSDNSISIADFIGGRYYEHLPVPEDGIPGVLHRNNIGYEMEVYPLGPVYGKATCSLVLYALPKHRNEIVRLLKQDFSLDETVVILL